MRKFVYSFSFIYRIYWFRIELIKKIFSLTPLDKTDKGPKPSAAKLLEEKIL